MKSKKWKKMISLFLSLVIVISNMQLTIFALGDLNDFKKVRGENIIKNGGFEHVTESKSHNNQFFKEGNVEHWKTLDKSVEDKEAGISRGHEYYNEYILEVPEKLDHNLDLNMIGIGAYLGLRFLELNSTRGTTVYQIIETKPDTEYEWSLAHTARVNKEGTFDSMKVNIISINKDKLDLTEENLKNNIRTLIEEDKENEYTIGTSFGGNPVKDRNLLEGERIRYTIYARYTETFKTTKNSDYTIFAMTSLDTVNNEKNKGNLIDDVKVKEVLDEPESPENSEKPEESERPENPEEPGESWKPEDLDSTADLEIQNELEKPINDDINKELEEKLNRKEHFAYIQGYPDETIRPEANISREEVSAVIFRILNPEYRDKIRSENTRFTDINKSRWSNKHISTIEKGLIIKGYEDGSFRPENNITRAEVTAIITRFTQGKVNSGNKFSDVNGHWAEKYINYAANQDWIKGYEDGSFRPDEYITRAEFVTMINSILDRGTKIENMLEDRLEFKDLSKEKWYYENMQEAINSHKFFEENQMEIWTEIYEFKIEM